MRFSAVLFPDGRLARPSCGTAPQTRDIKEHRMPMNENWAALERSPVFGVNRDRKAYAALTVIFFSCFCAVIVLGSAIVSTPLSNTAEIFSKSTHSGTANHLSNEPYRRSEK